jgi:hypothetical protein
MHSFLDDDGEPAAEAAMALHRQEEDRGTVDTVGPAADQTLGQNRQPDMERGWLRHAAARGRQNGREPEGSATIRVMCMTMGAGRILAPLASLLQGVGRLLIDVVMDGSVGVNMNMNVNGRNLFGDFIEAVGRGGAVPKSQGSRGHKNAGHVGQRHKPRRQAALVQTGQGSEHAVIASASPDRAYTKTDHAS